MPEKKPLLEEYLTTRALFEPSEIVGDIIAGIKEMPVGEEILSNDETLGQVADLWQNKHKALEAVIRARIRNLVLGLVYESVPQETIVIRQSILELVAIVDDFKKYTDEHIRREEIKNRP